VLGRLAPPLGDEFIHVETTSAIALLVAAVAALVWANVDGSGYAAWWSSDLTVGVGDVAITATRHACVNDGLLSIFFLLVGLELKRELVSGELRDRRRVVLPALAALGGMAAAALLFVATRTGTDADGGWAVPMATDIPFALGVLAIAGRKLPPGARLFLLSLALFDDLASLVVIAVFFSGGVSATVVAAGLGLLVPARPIRGRRVLEQMEHWLLPVSSFVVIPLFALANAGIDVGGVGAGRVTLGVVAGRVVGKPLGIVVITALAMRMGLGVLPSGVRLRDVVAIGTVAGIGFTVALFVADRALEGPALAEARSGTLLAAVVSAALGAVLLLRASAGHRRT